jgi:radical SAM protein with 4Fe4S-binding SPASM domain
MEFRTTKKFDTQTFDRLQKRIKDLSVTKRELIKNPVYAAPLPTEIDIQLTYACNLRCKMCYQWNDDGYFHGYNKEIQKKEVSVDLFDRILYETREVKSRLYLWGGEPLYHSAWDQIASAIETDPRHTVICTNGILIEKNMESLIRISPHLALLVSIDGLGETNNALRGKSTFERLIAQMDLLLEEQKKGNYKGTVSVNVVLNDALIPQLYEFVEFFEAKGIDSIYFNYPWYISEERANQMDLFYAKNFNELKQEVTTEAGSWHSYTFKLSEYSEVLLQQQIKMLSSRVWKLRVRFQQHLENHEIMDFITDHHNSSKRCFALANRIEVLADGKVGTCSKFFPELAIGNLNEQSLTDIWRSDEFNHLRQVVSRGLMPVCSKCILLYRNGL